MASKLDWTHQKFQFYALFIPANLLLILLFSYMGYVFHGESPGLISLLVVFIIFSYAFVILLLYLWLGLWPSYNLTTLYAVWSWQSLARFINIGYLVFVKGCENRAKIYFKLNPSKGEIRLVTIWPAEGLDAALKCTLNTTRLESGCPNYEALSYTWGSNHLRRSIELENTPFYVTKNLEIALRHLRLPHIPRQLWIDAICINQDDDIERGEQLQLMRKIYTQADQVLIWLGEATSCSEIAMEFFRAGSGEVDMKEWFKSTIVKTTEGLYTREWESVFCFQEREYWKRTWIIQEIICATKLELRCGLRSVSWETFISCLFAWHDVGHNTSNDGVHMSMANIQTPKAHEKMEVFISGSFWDRWPPMDRWTLPTFRPVQFERSRIAQRSSANSQRLANFMFNHQASHATDERDKIYAFAGISSDCQSPGFLIDYSVSNWTVYLKVIEYLLKNTGSLDMIAYCGIGKQYIGRPSWTPTFYWGELLDDAFQASLQLFGNAGSDTFAASKSIQAEAKFIACPRKFDRILGIDRTVLQAGGICVDVISQRLLYSDKWGDWKLGVDAKTQPEFHVTSSSWMATTVRRRKLNLIKFLCAFALRTPSASCVDEKRMASSKERKEEVFRTLVCDRTPEGSRAPEEWSDVFDVLMLGPSHVPASYETYSSSSLAVSSRERARAFVGPYLTAVDNTLCGDSWLFLTEKGRFGIANKNAKVGDKICVFLGCNMPLVIRHIDICGYKDDANAATVHGSAYLHYYMDGKAIEDLEARKLRLTTFSLR